MFVAFTKQRENESNYKLIFFIVFILRNFQFKLLSRFVRFTFGLIESSNLALWLSVNFLMYIEKWFQQVSLDATWFYVNWWRCKTIYKIIKSNQTLYSCSCQYKNTHFWSCKRINWIIYNGLKVELKKFTMNCFLFVLFLSEIVMTDCGCDSSEFCWITYFSAPSSSPFVVNEKFFELIELKFNLLRTKNCRCWNVVEWCEWYKIIMKI